MSDAVVGIKNLTGSDVTLESCGLLVPASSIATLKPDNAPNWPVRDDSELRARIQDDSFVLVYDGTEFSKLASLSFCDCPDFPVEKVGYVPHSEQPYTATATPSAPTVLWGGSFTLGHSVLLNRVVFRTLGFTGPAEAIVLLYQEPRGRLTTSLPLVATCAFTPAASTTFEVAPAEGQILLAPGLLFALWGQVSGGGTFQLYCYNTPSAILRNATVPAGLYPDNFVTILDPAAPPATLDPTSDLTGASGADRAPVVLLRNV